MSIQSELALLESTKDENRIAIMEKGVIVYSDDPYSVYPTRISQISMTAGDKDGLLADIIDKSVTSLTIPNGTTVIRKYAFSDCNLLASLTIPDTVKVIREYAFFNTHQTNGHYSQLTEITIPDSVTSIGEYAFYNIDTLTSITVLSETPFTIGSHSLDTNNCPIYCQKDSVQSFKTAWGAYSSRIQAMPDDTLFNSIVDRSVTEIEIPNDVTTIGQYAFYDCTSLTTVTIPSSVTSIQYGAFSGCTALTSLTVNRTTPPTLVYEAIPNNQSLEIFVPSSAVATYQSASVWSQYSSKIQAIPS